MLDRQQCRRRFPAAAAIMLAALVGCVSGEPVSSAFDPLTRFPAEATFVWDEAANREPDDPRVRDLNFGPRLRELTTEVLAARGYREAESDSADYQISYQLSVHTWISPDQSTSVGSLSITMVDARSGRRVWMGFAQAEAQVQLAEEVRNERLKTLLEAMFKAFPPGSSQ